jgi:hypothetical protein
MKDPIDKLIESAHSLAGLNSGDIWALMSVLLFGYIYWTKKQEILSNKGWQDIREKQIASEAAQTEVMKRLTEEIVALKMIITKFLIKE